MIKTGWAYNQKIAIISRASPSARKHLQASAGAFLAIPAGGINHSLRWLWQMIKNAL
jgi:hypothetical protein